MITFYIFYDTLWFVMVYSAVYKGMDLFFRDYSQSLKILFDIDANRFGYNEELHIDKKHKNLFWTTSPISFVILTLNPFIHSVVYMTVFMMISVMDMNRVLYYILLFKLAYRFNLFEYRFDIHFKPCTDMCDFSILCQLVLTMVNYSNTGAVIPTLFQLVDESTGISTVVLVETLEAHASLFRCDTKLNAMLLGIKAYFAIRDRKLFWTKFGVLATIFTYNVLCVATLTSVTDLLFSYYSAARLVQIYAEDLKAKRS
jgi:hypothetical protein